LAVRAEELLEVRKVREELEPFAGGWGRSLRLSEVAAAFD
jgi:hypothetical protein